MKKSLLFLVFLFVFNVLFAQKLKWSKDGNAYLRQEKGEIVQYTLPDLQAKSAGYESTTHTVGRKYPPQYAELFFHG